MKPSLSRRTLLSAGLATAPAVALATLLPAPFTRRALAAQADGGAGSGVGPSFPTQEPSDVREMVGVSHGNLDRVRELVSERPELAKAAWDWGFGDWETALGAASHTGNRAIAELLIENGARPDIFTAAMLGNLDAVRSFVAASPGIQRLPGPHSITLLSHAEAGGEAAEPVVRYLTDLGGADERPKNLPLSDQDRDALLGTYAFGDGPDDRFEITVHRSGNLFFQRGEGVGRVLFHQGDKAFHPAGAPSARIRFAPGDRGGPTLTIQNAALVVTVQRQGAQPSIS